MLLLANLVVDDREIVPGSIEQVRTRSLLARARGQKLPPRPGELVFCVSKPSFLKPPILHRCPTSPIGATNTTSHNPLLSTLKLLAHDSGHVQSRHRDAYEASNCPLSALPRQKLLSDTDPAHIPHPLSSVSKTGMRARVALWIASRSASLSDSVH